MPRHYYSLTHDWNYGFRKGKQIVKRPRRRREQQKTTKKFLLASQLLYIFYFLFSFNILQATSLTHSPPSLSLSLTLFTSFHMGIWVYLCDQKNENVPIFTMVKRIAYVKGTLYTYRVYVTYMVVLEESPFNDSEQKRRREEFSLR